MTHDTRSLQILVPNHDLEGISPLKRPVMSLVYVEGNAILNGKRVKEFLTILYTYANEIEVEADLCLFMTKLVKEKLCRTFEVWTKWISIPQFVL